MARKQRAPRSRSEIPGKCVSEFGKKVDLLRFPNFTHHEFKRFVNNGTVDYNMWKEQQSDEKIALTVGVHRTSIVKECFMDANDEERRTADKYYKGLYETSLLEYFGVQWEELLKPFHIVRQILVDADYIRSDFEIPSWLSCIIYPEVDQKIYYSGLALIEENRFEDGPYIRQELDGAAKLDFRPLGEDIGPKEFPVDTKVQVFLSLKNRKPRRIAVLIINPRREVSILPGFETTNQRAHDRDYVAISPILNAGKPKGRHVVCAISWPQPEGGVLPAALRDLRPGRLELQQLERFRSIMLRDDRKSSGSPDVYFYYCRII